MILIQENYSISQIYEAFEQKNQLLYKFIDLNHDYSTRSRDYGSGITATMVEIHTLSCIADNPGITSSALAALHRKTKGAISQIVIKLEKKGYIYREKHPSDKKKVLLFVTKEGENINIIHKKYDTDNMKITLDRLLEKCTMDEIDTFFKVVSVFNENFEKDLST